MHPDLKEKINTIYSDHDIEQVKLTLLVDAINEMLMDLEYEICINKKLATHYLNEYKVTDGLLTTCKLRCLELEIITAKLQNSM